METIKKMILNPISMLLIGLCLGVASRLLDIYTQNLGNIFSQMAIWILFGTIISIYSQTKKKAMLNMLPFCIGMLITYYFVAFVTDGVYSNTFIIGWTAFAIICPILAYFTWMTKEKGLFAKIISFDIVLFSVLSTILLFDKLRVYDIFINILLIYFLFFKKVKR
ncbi:DUF6518 family protein [Bengtsoniella intestinalis]|uniref:DUF6518 family protein n=1 Tax=Bengtsoniella intestinalis TaxID=3073143 RepID=UPI00391EE757